MGTGQRRGDMVRTLLVDPPDPSAHVAIGVVVELQVQRADTSSIWCLGNAKNEWYAPDGLPLLRRPLTCLLAPTSAKLD